MLSCEILVSTTSYNGFILKISACTIMSGFHKLGHEWHIKYIVPIKMHQKIFTWYKVAGLVEWRKFRLVSWFSNDTGLSTCMLNLSNILIRSSFFVDITWPVQTTSQLWHLLQDVLATVDTSIYCTLIDACALCLKSRPSILNVT